LLGLCSPAEREQIEAEYFDDEDAFGKMLAAEDDLIDAYVRGELISEERQRFEQRFVSSLVGTDRVQFARAFAGSVSATRSVKTKLRSKLLDIFQTFRSPVLSRTATIAAVIVFVAVLGWLVIDRGRMTNEVRKLRTESAELNKRTAELRRSSENERTRTAEIRAQLADLQAQPDKPTGREREITAAQRMRYWPQVKNDREKISSSKRQSIEKLINTQDASLRKTSGIRITELPVLDTKFTNVANLQAGVPRGGFVARGRAEQAHITLDGVDDPLDIYSSKPRTLSSDGSTTVSGTIQDPQGKVVSGATVTLTEPAKNFTRTQSTDEDGAYVFKAIPLGTYSLEVNARGFKRVSASNFTTLVDSPTVRDVHLEVGTIPETVNAISAAEAVINTSDATTIGNSFTAKVITDLPLNARDVVGLLSLQPGASRTDPANGGRDQSNITLGGVDATIRIPGSLGWVRFQIPIETAAIHEDYRITIKRANGHPVTTIDWVEPLTPNQTIIDTPVISLDDLPFGDYLLVLMAKEPAGSFVKIAEHSFKVIKY
jgi:hypothetical protein